jgi:hypothetical protein
VIISASRRTDIPAFYARWFMNRLRAGFCEVRNPFNAGQVSRVSLAPGDVSAIVFWTRDPRPLLPRLPEIRSLGHEPFFLMTLLDNPRALDPKGPDAATGLAAFAALAGALPGRVAWRYDPIVLTEKTPADWHRAAFARLAPRLAGHTDRVIVSFLEPYRKIAGRLRGLAEEGYGLLPPDPDAALALLLDLKDMAAGHGMALSTCCQPEIFQAAGIPASRCIDPVWIGERTGKALPVVRDQHQRPGCGCAPSKDIGAYDRCLFGCRYCYATTSFARAAANFAAHDSEGVSL